MVHEACPVQFSLTREGNGHFALIEPNSFGLQVAVGRDWICYPVPPHVVQRRDMLSDLADKKSLATMPSAVLSDEDKIAAPNSKTPDLHEGLGMV